MVQVMVLDGQLIDLSSPFDDDGVTSEVGVGRSDIVEALMVTVIVIMIYEGLDLVLETARPENRTTRWYIERGLYTGTDSI